MRKKEVSTRIAAENRHRILSCLEREACPHLTLRHSGILRIWLRSSGTEEELKERIQKLLNLVGGG